MRMAKRNARSLLMGGGGKEKCNLRFPGVAPW